MSAYSPWQRDREPASEQAQRGARAIAPSSVAVGTTLDRRYLLLRELTQGKTCRLYEAENVFTRRPAAVKVAEGAPPHDANARVKILSEAKILGAIRHPGVVDVIDAGVTAEGTPFLAMEMLEGRTLEGILAARNMLPIDEALEIAAATCDAVAQAHARGIVHREIRPTHIFVHRPNEGPARIKLIGWSGAVAPRAGGTVKLSGVFSAGAAEYAAPEQILSRSVDPRCDVYALGVTLYECLTGHVPFSGSHPEVRLKLSENPGVTSPCMLRPELPEHVGALVLRAVAFAPDARFPDAVAFAKALREARASLDRPSTEASSSPHRRRFHRASYLTPVRIVRADGSAVDGRSEDVSEGGMQVLVPRELVNGEEVRVRFAAPMGGTIVTLTATARWVRSARSGKGATGLEFVSIPEEVRRSLAQYVTAMREPEPGEPRTR